MPDLIFIAECVLLGAFAGFAGGMLGIGGGVVIVPVLVLLLDARELVAHADVTRVAERPDGTNDFPAEGTTLVPAPAVKV